MKACQRHCLTYYLFCFFTYYILAITLIYLCTCSIWTEKAMATHSSTLAWKVPWTQEPGPLLGSMGSLWVGTTEQLHFPFSLSCIGEGNGNPLQCSCLENSRDRWAWWAAVYGVAQSRTRLKQLSNSSSSIWKWRRQWHPTPVLLPGKSHGQRSLVGCSERLPFHFSLSRIGEGNGNPLSILA